MAARRVRIGIDTGGTFTDVVAVDEETGRTTTTKTPSTPADPAEGFLDGVRKVLDLMGLTGEAITAVSLLHAAVSSQLGERGGHGGTRESGLRRDLRGRHRLATGERGQDRGGRPAGRRAIRRSSTCSPRRA